MTNKLFRCRRFFGVLSRREREKLKLLLSIEINLLKSQPEIPIKPSIVIFSSHEHIPEMKKRKKMNIHSVNGNDNNHLNPIERCHQDEC